MWIFDQIRRERSAWAKGQRKGSWCDRRNRARRAEGRRLHRRAADHMVARTLPRHRSSSRVDQRDERWSTAARTIHAILTVIAAIGFFRYLGTHGLLVSTLRPCHGGRGPGDRRVASRDPSARWADRQRGLPTAQVRAVHRRDAGDVYFTFVFYGGQRAALRPPGGARRRDVPALWRGRSSAGHSMSGLPADRRSRAGSNLPALCRLP